MGTLHQLPTDKNAHVRVLQKLVNDVISQHPNSAIAQRWTAMAEETLACYPGPPLPSQPLLNLSDVEGLSDEQVELIHTRCDHWMQSYFTDVLGQLMSVHADFLKLQKDVAELQEKQSAT